MGEMAGLSFSCPHRLKYASLELDKIQQDSLSSEEARGGRGEGEERRELMSNIKTLYSGIGMIGQ